MTSGEEGAGRRSAATVLSGTSRLVCGAAATARAAQVDLAALTGVSYQQSQREGLEGWEAHRFTHVRQMKEPKPAPLKFVMRRRCMGSFRWYVRWPQLDLRDYGLRCYIGRTHCQDA